MRKEEWKKLSAAEKSAAVANGKKTSTSRKWSDLNANEVKSLKELMDLSFATISEFQNAKLGEEIEFPLVTISNVEQLSADKELAYVKVIKGGIYEINDQNGKRVEAELRNVKVKGSNTKLKDGTKVEGATGVYYKGDGTKIGERAIGSSQCVYLRTPKYDK